MLGRFVRSLAILMMHTALIQDGIRPKQLFAPASDYFAEGFIISCLFAAGQHNNFPDLPCIMYNQLYTTTEWCFVLVIFIEKKCSDSNYIQSKWLAAIRT